MTPLPERAFGIAEPSFLHKQDDDNEPDEDFDMNDMEEIEPCVDETLEDEDKMSTTSDDDNKILQIEDVWPILAKMGCCRKGSCYFLPSTCDGKPEQGFDSADDLRRQICKFGIPTCSRKPQAGLNDSEELKFKRWVRYSIVPFLDTETVMPDYGETSPQEVKLFFRNRLNIPFKSGYFRYQNMKLDQGSLMKFFATEGVNRNSLTGFNDCKTCQDAKREARKIMMCIAEDKDIEPFIYCTIHRPTRLGRNPQQECVSTPLVTKELSKSPDPLRLGMPSSINGSFWELLGSQHNQDVDFTWGAIIGWREHLGRAYFASFKLRGLELKPGDFVVRRERESSSKVYDEVFQIISAFQAMKSWVGKWNKGPQNELQKRGHCYLELVRFETAKSQNISSFWDLKGKGTLILDRKMEATIPCWFQNESYSFQKLSLPIRILVKKRNSNKQQVSEELAQQTPSDLADHYAAWCWDPARHARQVQFVQALTAKASLSKPQHPGLSIFVAESSDDSDGDEDKDDDDQQKPAAPSKPPRRPPAPKSFVSQDWFPSTDPLPQLVVGNLTFESYDNEISCAELEQDLDIAKALARKNYEDAPAFVHKIEQRLRMVRPILDIVELNPKPETMDRSREPELQSSLKQLGFQNFRQGPQRDVCLAALESRDDIMCVAPCGFGKSMCFVLPAILQGGITLVVEPLRVLVDNMAQCLSSTGKSHFDIIPLLSLKDAEQTQQEHHYADRLLSELVLQLKSNGFTGKPLLLVAVAELVNKPHNMGLLKDLAMCGALRRIVIDEFDVIEESNANYRETYLSLVPNVREACRGVPLMFLSGTTTKRVVLNVLAPLTSTVTKVFTHSRALPDNLVFGVERKQDNKQVAQRILSILSTYLKVTHDKSTGPLKVLCCCLTHHRCEAMKDFLLHNSKLDVQVDIITSKTSKHSETIQSFQTKSSHAVHILCVTKALGRGFHADDIRFVFHTTLPLSPSNYIQEAGRAGRGQSDAAAFCILFFRKQDCSAAANITNQHKLTEEQVKFNQSELQKVIHYCRAADRCRYSILASYATLPENMPWDQKCRKTFQCDNCRNCSPFQSKLPLFVKHKENEPIQLETCTQPINDLVLELLPLYEKSEMTSPHANAGRWQSLNSQGDRVNLGEKIWQDCFQRYATHKSASLMGFGSSETCLANELYRLLVRLGIVDPGQTSYSKRKFSVKRLRILIKNYKYTAQTSRGDTTAAMTDFDEDRGHQSMQADGKLPPETDMVTESRGVGFSFLLQFEKRRTQRDRLIQGGTLGNIGGLPLGLEQVCSKKPTYLDVITRATEASAKVDEGTGSYLFFSARLPADAKGPGDLELLPPERALDRRIFRKFGSHRFLHINVQSKVTKEVRKLIFGSNPIVICGRHFTLLWGKHTKSPQVYVLFAEKGVGIHRGEETSSQQVLEWCLCPEANPSLTLGRLVKRMKLCFSKTIASGLLPEGSVEVFPDIKSPNGSVMTDGCGLVSKRALLAIWDAYWQESVIRGESDRPPVMCTSFQGRLGGFKGTWVLSEALGYEQEFRIVCTESQLKFNLPQKCLRTCPHTDGWDPAYDTMEVCRWNSAMEEAPLNNRLIQCLESRAFGENAMKLQDLLENCVNDRCRQLTDLKDPSKWFRFTLKKNRQTPQEDEKGVGCTDTKMLFEMSVCGVEQTDPTFVRRRKRLLAHEFKNMRKKGHYPIEKARYVWIFPDFSGLLEEGEAYLALDNEVVTSRHVLALRSPSYFAEDLRKLRLVGLEELKCRTPWMQGSFEQLPLPGMEFLVGTRNALILSTKGMRPEAGKMSGGDHDGDICWVCWNDDLVSLVDPSQDGAVLSIPEPKKSELEQKNAWKLSRDDMFDFIFHHRGHQNQLGTLANLLDKTVDEFGFNHQYAREIGSHAFFQVDHPYTLCQPSLAIKQAVEKLPSPHWMERSQQEPSRRSKAILGVLWDVVEEKLNMVVKGDYTMQPDSRIMAYVQSAADLPLTHDFVDELRKQMRQAIEGWVVNKELLQGARVDNDSALSTQREKYLQQQLKDLILLQNNDVLDRRKLAAAVLYEQAHFFSATSYERDLVQDVTWMLGLRWLLGIVVGGDNSDEMPPLPIKNEYVGEIFNKRRRLQP